MAARPGASVWARVARLAGLPGSLLRRARTTLQSLEQGATGHQPQLDLFTATAESSGPSSDWLDESRDDVAGTDLASTDRPGAPIPSEAVRSIVDEMRALDIDELTPRQALERLAAWRERLVD